MKRTTMSIVHLILAICAFLFGIGLKGQSYPEAGKHVEMIPYRIVPTYGGMCYVDIEIVEPAKFNSMVETHSEEVREILMDRIVFELTNPYAENELFIIDGNYYYLIRVPYTGALWDGRYNRSFR
tara:strand:- start:58 stop:432 length:375 start_codon:yes stop_codon:yes gene_type:complete